MNDPGYIEHCTCAADDPGRSRYRCEGSLVVLTVSPRVRSWIRRRIMPATGQYGTQLAVAARARTPAAKDVAEKAVGITIAKLPKHLAAEQLDAILGMVDQALRAHLENRMMVQHQYRSPLFRGIFKKGEIKGKAKGKAEGKAEGEIKGKAESILAVLSAREIPVSDTVRDRILGCTDPATLDLWIQRAAVASTAAAVVRAKPAAKAARAQR